MKKILIVVFMFLLVTTGFSQGISFGIEERYAQFKSDTCEGDLKECFSANLTELVSELGIDPLVKNPTAYGINKGLKRMYILFVVDVNGNMRVDDVRASDPELEGYFQDVLVALPQVIPARKILNKGDSYKSIVTPMEIRLSLPVRFDVK